MASRELAILVTAKGALQASKDIGKVKLVCAGAGAAAVTTGDARAVGCAEKPNAMLACQLKNE